MPTSNFLIFDQNKANMIGDEAYQTSTQRLNGVQSGVASSMLNNKFAYQVSLVAYAIAQIMNQNGIDATDTMAVSQFVNNLSSTFLQKVVDKASVADAVAASSDSKWMSPKTVKSLVSNVLSGKTGIKIVNGTISQSGLSATVSFGEKVDILIGVFSSSTEGRGSDWIISIKSGADFGYTSFASYSINSVGMTQDPFVEFTVQPDRWIIEFVPNLKFNREGITGKNFKGIAIDPLYS